jgi:hypothetical protein
MVDTLGEQRLFSLADWIQGGQLCNDAIKSTSILRQLQRDKAAFIMMYGYCMSLSNSFSYLKNMTSKNDKNELGR